VTTLGHRRTLLPTSSGLSVRSFQPAVRLRSGRCGSAGTVSGEELETVVEEVIDNGDKVVMAVRYRGRGRGSGVEVNDRLFEVHTFRDGQCVRKVDFRERSEALEAAGLEI
jgi:hypothetical protein